jgi:hypothetical protein
MCFLILILIELLFMYHNPGTNAIIFFGALFVIFVLIFMLLGISVSLTDVIINSTSPTAIWCACTDMVLAVFFALLEAVTDRIPQPENIGCVNFCKVGTVLYILLFRGRAALLRAECVPR